MPEPTAIVPDKGIRGCLNTLAADIPAGTLVVLTTGAGDAPYSIAVAGAGAGVLGVTMENILGTDALAPDDVGPHRGNVQVEGKAIVIAGAAVARGAQVASNATGRGITAVSTNITAGRAITPAAADGDLYEVELAGPGGGIVLP
jgi:hypothetical protein